MYHKPRSLVTYEFRNQLGTLLSGLKENPAYWEFTALLRWGRNEGNGVVISREMLASIERKTHLLNINKYTGKTFLDKYSQDVMKIEYSDWNIKQCRTITFIDWPKDVDELFRKETDRMIEGKKVYMSTGQEYTKHLQEIERETDREYALSRMALASNPEAVELLKYMNALPHNRFKSVLNHIDEAYEIAAQIENPFLRHEQIANLRAIQDQYQVFYVPKGRTARVFSLNLGLTTIRKDLRRILTQEWIELDLQNSQLAIAAKYWDIPEVTEFLQTKTSIWNELHKHFGTENHPKKDDIKIVLKKALYALMYGMSINHLTNGKDSKWRGLNTLLLPYGIENAGDIFMNHPIIKVILKKRNKMLNQIRTDKGIVDIYGVWLPINKYQKEPSVLAQYMQAIELHLVYPVIELAKSTEQFQVMIFQHDGFSILIRDKHRKDLWIARIKEVIQTRIDSYNIITRLVE